VELGELKLNGESVADLFHPTNGKLRMKTRQERDGKKDWNVRIYDNYYTYAEAESLMKGEKLEEIKAEQLRWQNYFRLNFGKEFDFFKNSFVKPLANLVEKEWGGDRIERLKQMPKSRRKVGESWECSIHPNSPSKLKIKGVEVPLIHLLNYAGKEILGEKITEFKGKLPILLKFIDAKDNLSIQVHPSDELAKKLGEKDSGKNEAWLILDTKPASKIYLGLKEEVKKADFINADKLNSIEVKAGDVYIIPEGTVHAVGAGIFLFEIEQTSDLTYRIWDWERVPKRPLHMEKAAKVLNFKPARIEKFKLTPRYISPHETLLVDTPHFKLSSVKLKGFVRISTKGSFHILSCLKGKVKVKSGVRYEILSRGESLLVPASLELYNVSPVGSGAVILKSYL
jgi:mannose-6-phosphate isomerase